MLITKENLEINLFRAIPSKPRFPHLNEALRNVSFKGEVLEFGVFNGSSIVQIAKKLPDMKIFGFDSFEGLPEEWVRTKKGNSYKEGHFKVNELPTVPDNVTLVKGFFNDTLPEIVKDLGDVAFLHNDSDLYSSTIFVLESLNSKIVPGTVIVFDELCDWTDSGIYDNWVEHEWKALKEWVTKYDRSFEIIGRGNLYEVSIKIIK